MIYILLRGLIGKEIICTLLPCTTIKVTNEVYYLFAAFPPIFTRGQDSRMPMAGWVLFPSCSSNPSCSAKPTAILWHWKGIINSTRTTIPDELAYDYISCTR